MLEGVSAFSPAQFPTPLCWRDFPWASPERISSTTKYYCTVVSAPLYELLRSGTVVRGQLFMYRFAVRIPPRHPLVPNVTATKSRIHGPSTLLPLSRFVSTMVYKGACYCKAVQYEIDIASPDEARTSLCHCYNCKVRVRIPQSVVFGRVTCRTVHLIISLNFTFTILIRK